MAGKAKEIKETAETKVYTGVTVRPIKIGKKQYGAGEKYETKHKPSFDSLINAKIIK